MFLFTVSDVGGHKLPNCTIHANVWGLDGRVRPLLGPVLVGIVEMLLIDSVSPWLVTGLVLDNTANASISFRCQHQLLDRILG